MKTLWKMAIGMIKHAKAKLGTQKTKKETMAEFDEIATFMEAVHAIEDEMTNVKHELQSIKKTVENSEQAIKDSEKTTKCNWAAIVATPKAATPSVNLRVNKREIDEEAQQKRTQCRFDNATFEITLTAEGAPRTTRSQITIDNHEAVTKRLQEAVQRAVGMERAPTLLGVQKLKSGAIRFKCETEEGAQRLCDINWSITYPSIKVCRRKYGVVIHGVPIKELNPHHDDMEDPARQIKK
jgi:hypothetical protein